VKEPIATGFAIVVREREVLAHRAFDAGLPSSRATQPVLSAEQDDPAPVRMGRDDRLESDAPRVVDHDDLEFASRKRLIVQALEQPAQRFGAIPCRDHDRKANGSWGSAHEVLRMELVGVSFGRIGRPECAES